MSIKLVILFLIGSAIAEYPEKTHLRAVFCPDEPGKAKGICAFNVDPLKPDFKYIQNNCRKNQKCNLETGSCENVIKLQNHRQFCTTHEDCISEQCLSGKCIPLSAGVECETHRQCVSGYFCQKTKIANVESSHCEKLPRRNEKAKRGLGYQDTKIGICGFGDAEDGEGICRYFGNKTVGEKGIDPRVCQTGILLNDICIEIKSAGKCILNEHGVYVANLTYVYAYVGEGKNRTELTETVFMNCTDSYDKDGKIVYYLDGYSTHRQTFFKAFLEKADKYDFDYFFEETYNWYDVEGTYNQQALKENYFLYNYAEYLVSTGIVDKNGEVKRKCEFDYFQKNFLSGKVFSVSFWLMIVLGLLGI